MCKNLKMHGTCALIGAEAPGRTRELHQIGELVCFCNVFVSQERWALRDDWILLDPNQRPKLRFLRKELLKLLKDTKNKALKAKICGKTFGGMMEFVVKNTHTASRRCPSHWIYISKLVIHKLMVFLVPEIISYICLYTIRIYNVWQLHCIMQCPLTSSSLHHVSFSNRKAGSNWKLGGTWQCVSHYQTTVSEL